MISVQNDKLVDFDHVPLYEYKLVKSNNLEYISDILINFQTSPSLVSEIYAF